MEILRYRRSKRKNGGNGIRTFYNSIKMEKV